MQQQQQQRESNKRRVVVGTSELGDDLLRLIFEFASLDAYVFWPNTARKSEVLQRIALAASCSCVNRAWHHSSSTLPTRLCGQPPETFGDDARGESHRRAFELLTKTRRVCSLELYTLGNHAKKAPLSGRTRVDLDRLLSLNCLRTVKLSASGLFHRGISLKSLAVAIANSSVEKISFRLKTGDQKPKALVFSPRHKDQQLHRLAEAVLTTPDAARILSVRYEQSPGTHEEYSRSLVIQRRTELPSERLSKLVSTKANQTRIVDLDPELTLLLLYSSEFALAAAKPQLFLSLRFENRMSEAEMRRFQKLPQPVADLVSRIDFTRDESRGFRVIGRLKNLSSVGPLRLVRPHNFTDHFCFQRIVELSLNGDPSPADIPLSCKQAKLVHTTLVAADNPQEVVVDCPIVFDFSEHNALKKLCLVGQRATAVNWVVKRLPPSASSVDLENVLVRPDAHKISTVLDTLKLEACGSPRPTDTFSLVDWLSKTGCKDLNVANCDRMNWSLGANLDELCTALRKSRVQRLRLSALLASGTFDTSSPTGIGQCGGRQRAVADILDHDTVLRRQMDNQDHLSQLRQLFQSNDAVFFDLYYRTGEHHAPEKRTHSST